MTLLSFLYSPFSDYGFMRRALAACAAIAVGGAPLGVFLVLRRMTLMGDAISHAILPGTAIAFLYFGFSLTAMTVGGLCAGLLIAIVAGTLTHITQLKEDASFTGIYLISLAAGVLLISLHGNSADLMHVLFGNVLAVNNGSLLLMNSIATFSALTLAIIYRRLIIQCFDPAFLHAAGAHALGMDLLFLALVVLNLVAAFQVLGTLMALSIIILPAITSRFWCNSVDGALGLSIALSLLSSYAGLLLSFYTNVPSGPSIVLFAGAAYLLSVFAGRYGSVYTHFSRRKHFTS